jgi:hypothetical protein
MSILLNASARNTDSRAGQAISSTAVPAVSTANATSSNTATTTCMTTTTTTTTTIALEESVQETTINESVQEEFQCMDQDSSPDTLSGEHKTNDELQRQQPDGIFIDGAKQAFAILDLTRPYDSTRNALLDTDKKKREKNKQHLCKLQELLPGWEGTIVTFSLGVRGAVLEPQWKRVLRSLNIPDQHHPCIILAAIKGAMEGLDTMLQTRSAQLQLGQSVVNVPRQPLFPNPQSRQPSLG